ncbi:MAG: hypothetical protein ACLUGV_01985 [Alistipes shahii]|jgi:hypothetical protein|uniref:hypothetical protein n=1 Tax=Alistipes onderdonkii TaxID=328813 RepID=UPI00189CEA2B|nr:hypothetical protein [Alistipes onderdonkii]
MKSEKAREFIDGCINNLTVDMPDHVERRLRLAMTHTAELAEQEAEERMRAKAIEAYCQDCGCRVENECGIDSDSCIAFRTFIQKLSEK